MSSDGPTGDRAFRERIDILVNNAGRLVVKPLVEQTEEEWDRVVDVNLKGVFLCCRYVLPEPQSSLKLKPLPCPPPK
jgi:NAD(P)-dependent dehydrogenase (short-subunit alcohol dehydrogenase family)